MAEYTMNSSQLVSLNGPLAFDDFDPCKRGCVYHGNGDGVFILRGATDSCFASYRVAFNGNACIPEGGTAGPIAIAIAVNGEPRATSKAIYTPTAVGAYGNLTSTCLVKVPRGCCYSMSVEYVSGTTDPTDTPAPAIEVINSNLVITRVAN